LSRPHWTTTPPVAVHRPACPHSLAVDPPKLVRTDKRRDGGVVRRCVCQVCNQPFRVEVNCPTVGQLVRWPRGTRLESPA